MSILVTLNGVGVGDKQFEIEHAQNILNITALPKAWKLNDPNYKFVGKPGKGVLVPANAPAQSATPTPAAPQSVTVQSDK